MSDSAALREFDSLPGPKGIPFLGNALQVKADRIHQQLEVWAREFGPVYKVTLGKMPVMVVSDHKIIGTMLRDRPDGFARSIKFNKIWVEMGLPTGVFGADGDVWRRQRRMVMAGFDPAHVMRYFPALKDVGRVLETRWTRNAREQTPIDLQADFMRFTVDTIAGLAFGARVNTLESDGDLIQKNLDKIFPAIFNRMFAAVPTWRYLPSREDRELKVALREVMMAVNGFVAQARERMDRRRELVDHPENLLEAMIAAADQPGSGIDDTQVAGNVLTLLLAGEDTTANTLAWLVYQLWTNPDTLAKATAEVRRVCGDARDLTLEQLGQLDYLEACTHESMRLKTVAPQLGFQTLKDTVVGDVRVPKGTMILSVMRLDGVSEQYVSNPCAFTPERWMDGSNPLLDINSPRRVTMPFGGGPRICPGRYLAILEMKVAMATLLGRFDITALDTPDGTEPRENMALTMAPVGLMMKLRCRQ